LRGEGAYPTAGRLGHADHACRGILICRSAPRQDFMEKALARWQALSLPR